MINGILSGLLKPSTTQKIILSERLVLLVPEFSLREIEKYANEFTGRMGKTRQELEIALFTLLSRVKIVPKEEYLSFKQKALLLCPQGHKDDWPFLALAIKYSCPLWTNDKALERQSTVKIISTTELVKKLE